MLNTKVNARHQISLPREARHRLGIEAGDTLSVTVRGDELVLRRKLVRASARLRGLAAGSYGPDPDSYLRELRDEDQAGF